MCSQWPAVTYKRENIHQPRHEPWVTSGIVSITTSISTNNLAAYAATLDVRSETVPPADLFATSQTGEPSVIVLSDKSGLRNGVTLCFQMIFDSVFSNMMNAVMFAVIMKNACSELTFDSVMFAHHLEWYYGVALYIRLGHLFFTLTFWIVAVTFLLRPVPYLLLALHWKKICHCYLES